MNAHTTHDAYAPHQFDQVSISNIFEIRNGSLRISRKFADFLSERFKIGITCNLNRKGESEYFWQRNTEFPMSKDPYIIEFVESIVNAKKGI